MSYQLKEINHQAVHDPAGFLQACDEAFHAKIVQAANRIMENMKKSPLVLLSGPSGSGKTTTALKLAQELKERGVNTHTVSMDNYFLAVDRKDVPRTETGEIDYESPLNLDIELLDAHLEALERGEEIIVPKFEFSRQMRNDSRGRPLKLQKDEIAIFEGIHALNTNLFHRHPDAIRLYISARSNIMDGDILRFKGTWMRLTRRAVRDYNFRGTHVKDTMAMWATVRRGEKLYISPYKNRANIIIDSSLPYEVCVMKHFAGPLSQAVPQENPRRQEMLDMIHAFDYFEEIDPALVAQDSLLREFIGGGSYKYH